MRIAQILHKDGIWSKVEIIRKYLKIFIQYTFFLVKEYWIKYFIYLQFNMEISFLYNKENCLEYVINIINHEGKKIVR